MKQPSEDESNSKVSSAESVDLDYYYERAKVTIEALTSNMVKPEVSD